MIYKFKKYNKSPILRGHLNMGGKNPQGEQIDVTSLYFERGGKPWIGVMGEYHFVRAKREEWHRELCKMKAGGISVVSTYMFWIYHEELEGKFDFSDYRDVRAFVEECRKVGLDVILRIGPYAHGECRNGGFPDWLMEKPYKLRCNDENYLEKTKIFYEKIYNEVKDLFYKDGGNIIGIQLENENVGDAVHLAKLKEIAVEVGYDVPLYTVTGWNSERGAEIPIDEVIPVFSGYPEAPWLTHNNKLEPLSHFFFSHMRNEAAFDDELNVKSFSNGWQMPYERYPFATCELGCGVEINHNRRPIISPMDAYSLSLIKIGSGNNLIGYYMYHGGSNKIGKLSTLNEYHCRQWTKDCLTISYDFQAPLSEYGEAREHYGLLNMLHMFVTDFGEKLAIMEYVGAQTKPTRYDTSTLRYSMRTDGESGYVFVNHYQRLTELDDIYGAVIDTGTVKFPAIDVVGDICFFMPFNMDLSGVKLEYATAQPLCKVGDTYFFAEISGIKSEYKFADGEIFKASAGADLLFGKNGIKIVTFTPDEARYARKLDGGLYIGIGCNVCEDNGEIISIEDGSFSYLHWTGETFENHEVKREFENSVLNMENRGNAPFELNPEYSRELHLNGERALTWKKLSVNSDKGFVEINEVCDAAQIYADGILVADEFYYGVPWRIPASLLYGKECYLVMSEIKDDFYREF